MQRYFLENLWRWKCGLPEIELNQQLPETVLSQEQWNKDFEQLMRNRLNMGLFRYGSMADRIKPKYDCTSSIEKRIKKYRETGNMEFLVDIANLCMLEYNNPAHENAHFKSIDDGEHVKPL